MENIVWVEEARQQAENEFKDLFTRHITRGGAGDLLQWLEHTDFFEAPAGAKHHGAFRGGLLKHSLNVYRQLEADPEMERMTPETIAICGLLHDVCKIGVYHKDDDGYTFRDPLPMGHGEKSVYLLSGFIHLKDEEAVAIRWHMGAYDAAAKGGSKDLDAALSFSPLVYALHAADMRAMMEEKRQEAE